MKTSLKWSRRGLIAAGTALLILIAAGAIALSRGLLGAPSGPWRPAGLTGDTVHAIVEQHGTLFAATQDGVSRRDAGGHWHLSLNVGTVWGLQAFPRGHTLVAGDENGHVDVSHDGGKTWTKRMVSPQGVYAVTIRPGVPGTILAGAGGGLYLSRDDGDTWRRTLRLHNSAGAAFTWNGADTLFAGVVAGGPGGDTQVYVSRDAGQHWRIFGRRLGSLAGIMSLATAGGRLYTGTMGNTIWSIPLAGTIWHRTAAGIPPHQHVATIAVVPGHARRLYVGTLAAGVLRSVDGGARWTNISGGLPSDSGAKIVLSLAYIAPERAMYAGTSAGIYRMVNAG